MSHADPPVVSDPPDLRDSADILQQLIHPAEPRSFLDELADVWGPWGAHDDVGRLRHIAVRRPGAELEVITADAWRSDANALVDPDGCWYWTGSEKPDIGLVRDQHDGLIAALADNGVQVADLPSLGPEYVKAMYVRDPLITIVGGAIIGRIGVKMRRGEEAAISRQLAALGVPVLGTIAGNGSLEGGSFARLTRDLAVLGVGSRCNREGADQLRHLLATQGIELLETQLTGYSIHIDLHFAMVSPATALIRTSGLTHEFLQTLREHDISTVEVAPDEYWAINVLCLEPNRILTSTGSPKTAARLEAAGVEVLTIPYDEIQKGGGGIHCSTMELRRDPA